MSRCPSHECVGSKRTSRWKGNRQTIKVLDSVCENTGFLRDYKLLSMAGAESKWEVSKVMRLGGGR